MAGFFSNLMSGIKGNLQDPLTKKALIAGIGEIGRGQKEAADLQAQATRIASAPLLAGFDPKTISALVANEKEVKRALPGANIFAAIGPELLERISKKEEKEVNNTPKTTKTSSKIFKKLISNSSPQTSDKLDPNILKENLIGEAMSRGGVASEMEAEAGAPLFTQPNVSTLFKSLSGKERAPIAYSYIPK